MSCMSVIGGRDVMSGVLSRLNSYHAVFSYC